jgi:hypothetical protein
MIIAGLLAGRLFRRLTRKNDQQSRLQLQGSGQCIKLKGPALLVALIFVRNDISRDKKKF